MKQNKKLLYTIVIAITIVYILIYGFSYILHQLPLNFFEYFLEIEIVFRSILILGVLSLLRYKKIEIDFRLKNVQLIEILITSFLVIFLRSLFEGLWGGNTELSFFESPPKRIVFLSFLSLVLIIPIFEELFFRKFVIGKPHHNDIYLKLLISFVAFSLIHISPFEELDVSLVVHMLYIGLFLGIIYLRSGITGSILAHILLNLQAWLAFSFDIRLSSAVYSIQAGFLKAFFFLLLSLLFVYFSHVLRKVTKKEKISTPRAHSEINLQ